MARRKFFKAPPKNNDPRINERIRVPEVRLIADDGEQLGVVKTDDARSIATERGLDLVEVSPNADPPVCKLMDFGKFKYEQKKKQQVAKKKQHTVQIKEIRLRPKTDTHDIETKMRKARGFLEDGDKVMFKMRFRGRENVHRDLGQKVMEGLAQDLEDLAKIEKPPAREGAFMTLLLAPLKDKG